MRIDFRRRPQSTLKPRWGKTLSSFAAIWIASVLTVGPVFMTAQQPASQTPQIPATAHKTAHARRRPVKVSPPVITPQIAPVAAVVPKPPDWPANAHPAEATVVWNSQGLRIDAANSSLSQILNDVATTTGAKVAGMGADQRIFGSYGPGPARDVLVKLLDGSGYNVLMIGDQGQGTPREIVLSAQPLGSPAPVTNTQTVSSDDNADSDDQSQQQPQPQSLPQQPPAMRNGFGPGVPPRTPQQVMQEMQQQQVQQNIPPQ